ncbi:ABC transporter permease [Actinocrinis sp.]|uniref:ABC transporter permease n=1 Tax=Actinocrinis sp. TaxID=1920516 RepID=UPI002BF484C0|nr:ABC transporter permease [Actinocrinis sp.]HXR73730.1 ABC transporter permease [Actinocrinis sp.]
MSLIDLSLEPAPASQPPEGGEVLVVTSGWRLVLREFLRNKLAVAGVVLLVFFVVFCFLGPLVYHTDQLSTDLTNTDTPPGPGNPMGTDGNGFDVLGRIMLGGQTSLKIGFLSAFIATVIGTLWGAVSGLIGGVVDAVMMRIVDTILSIPFLLIVLIMAHRYGSNTWNMSLILGVFSWLLPARLVRGEVLTLRTRDYVAASKAMGGSNIHLIFKHLIPNAMGTVIVNITFQIADAILALAALGYLNFGVQYPNTDWGDQLSDGVGSLVAGYWWLVYPVGICLVLVVMAFNLIGDGLRDAVDVRLRKR